MEDLISRKDAKYMVKQTAKQIAAQNGTVDDITYVLKIVYDEMDEMPPVAVAPTWISVKERLPEAGARVLVAVGAVFEAYIDDAGVWQRYYSSPMKDVLGEPTHWMPLPEPPKEEP